MTITLVFTIPEEQGEADLALQAGGMAGVLWDVDQAMRQKLKYENLPADIAKVVEELRALLHEMADDHGAVAWRR